MSINKSYFFKEAQLGPDFAKEKLADFKRLIDACRSFVVISLPGVGVSYFLRYLAMQNFAEFFHIDLYSLTNLTQHEFYQALLTQLGGKTDKKTDQQLLAESRKILQVLTKNSNKIVLIFSRFDQLEKDFDWNFLSNIQSLSTVSEGKIVLIFTSIKPLYELSPEAVKGGNLNFYSKNLYFPPFSKEDLQKLLKINPEPISSQINLNRLLKLSGGHNQLLHILINSQKQQNLLLDNFVKLQMKGFLDYLDYFQKKQIQKIALKKTLTEIDEYLLGIGLVKKINSNYALFTPLLAEYIKTNLPAKLPAKERVLFNLLRKNLGKITPKDEIFTEVWGDPPAGGDEGVTDWALDALIYRLRKHPFMQAHGYLIENHKKQGYTLIQI